MSDYHVLDSVQQPSAEAVAAASDQTLKIKDLLWLCLSRWYWFVISLAICCGLGVYYILRTVPVYERSTQLLIKDDRLGGTAGGDVGASFSGIAFLQPNTNVLNELASITSPTVMAEVVSRLGLDVDYSAKGTFHDTPLYGTNLPLRFTFPDLGSKGQAAFEAVAAPDGSLTLRAFEDADGEIEGATPVTGRYDRIDTLQTPFGRVAVAPGAMYDGGKLTSDRKSTRLNSSH